MFDKRWMYEESFRMPLLVRWPGVTKPGSVNTDLTQNLDFAQTFLDIAGAEIPDDMQGRSLRPLLAGETPKDWRKSIYFQFYEDLGAHHVPRHYGVRTDLYKLMYFYKLDEWEMYDLQKDPDEMRSVYGQPEYAELQKDLTQELSRLREQYGVTEHADEEYDRFDALLNGRWKFFDALGKRPWHEPRNVEVLGTEELSDCTRERIAYNVGDQRIEAYVFSPKARDGLLPGIVAIHPGYEQTGSFAAGKGTLAERIAGGGASWAQEACRRGYVVIAPDRVGYESRRVSKDADSADAERKAYSAYACGKVAEGSSLLGQELSELWGACDYLTTRSEVHAKRVGVVGFGDGGFVATVVAMANEECWAAVSVDGLRPFANDEATCGLRTVPGVLAWGEMDRVVATIYPRPFLEIDTAGDTGELLKAAREQYSERDYSDRMERVHVSSGNAVGDTGVCEKAIAWLDHWLK